MLSSFPTETVQIRKPDGTLYRIVGHIQPRLFTTEDTSNPIDEGDIIERTLPNGKTELYEIFEADFYSRSTIMDDHYQCKIKKASVAARQRQANAIRVTTGDNARVTIASDGATAIDKSSNVITLAAARSDDEVDFDKWQHDVAEILLMVVNAQDKLEEDYRAVNAAVWKLAKVDIEQAQSLVELQESVKALLTSDDISALRRLRTLSSAIAINIVSSEIFQLIAPILD